jgi:two-component sensor histidine kinase
LSNILGKPIDVRGDEGDVATARIQPIGLLVNELVTNAAKHGTGKIEVAYRIVGNLHELSVCDDGKGLPAGFDPDQSVTGLGMRVINILAKQLGGRVIAQPNPTGKGSCFMVCFPA